MSTIQVKILGSGHHVHLNREALDVLYGKGFELEVKRYLEENSKELYVSKQQVTVVGPKGQLTCSILGALRPYNQVEISYTDAQVLGIRPKLSNSGVHEGTAPCKLIGPAGELELSEGMMIARRHIHMSEADQAILGCKVGDMVRVHIGGPRALTFEQVIVCKGKNSVMHVDYDEMNAAAFVNSDGIVGEVEFCRDPKID